MKVFLRFLNGTKLSFNSLNQSYTKEFFDYIGCPLFTGNFYKDTILPKLVEDEQEHIKYQIMSKPFYISFDECKLANVCDVVALDVANIDRKNFSKKSICDIKKLESKKANPIFTKIMDSLNNTLLIIKIQAIFEFW